MINTSNKIYKAHKIIKCRLPKSYYIPDIKIYKTIYSMLRASGENYQKTIKYYGKYFKECKNTKQGYINTKYYNPKRVDKHIKEVFEITAIADDPIKINLQNTQNYNLYNYTFLLLHEIGHHYYEKKKQMYNEHLADTFAIRWIKRIYDKHIK